MPRHMRLEGDSEPGRRRVGGRRAIANRPAAVPPAVHRFYADFTVDWYSGRPKLQRGLYLLGLAPGTWDAPVELPAPGVKPRHDLCSLVVSFEPLPEA